MPSRRRPVVEELALHPDAPTGHHVRAAIGSHSREPVVVRSDEPLLHLRAGQQSLGLVGTP